jgi:transcription antitermination factor NusG
LSNSTENKNVNPQVLREGPLVENTLGPFKHYEAIFKQFDGERRAIKLAAIVAV